jgi:MFS family permease
MGQLRFRLATYSYQFSARFIPIFALYGLMLSDRFSLTVLQITSLFCYWFIIQLASEIPTGLYADKYSPKLALFMGSLLKSGCLGVWFATTSFAGAIIGFTLLGVGGAFSSGAFESYLYTSIQKGGKVSHYAKISGLLQSVGSISVLSSYLLASLLGVNYGSILLASTLSSCVSLLAVAFLPKIESPMQNKLTIKDAKLAFKYVAHSKVRAYLVLSGALIGSTAAAGAEVVQFYYRSVGVSTSWVPVIMAIGFSVSAVLLTHAHKFEQRKPKFKFMLALYAGLILIFSSFGNIGYALAGALVYFRLMGVFSFLINVELQHATNKIYRTTVLSISSFVTGYISLIIFLLYGLVSLWAGSIWSFRMIASITVFFTIFCIYPKGVQKFSM